LFLILVLNIIFINFKFYNKRNGHTNKKRLMTSLFTKVWDSYKSYKKCFVSIIGNHYNETIDFLNFNNNFKKIYIVHDLTLIQTMYYLFH
jgi:hypothetical protein